MDHIIQRSQPIILDGGMSRELMRINAPFQQPEWSAYALMEAPECVQQIHSEFAAAGADVLTTNSYALVPFHIGEDRFWTRGEELATLAGRLARTAADLEYARTGRKVLVAGSLPPIFGSYEPDLFDENSVHKYLDVLVRGLSPYVDIWLGETLSLTAEAKAVQIAVSETKKPFWIAYTIDDHEDGGLTRLRGGHPVEKAVAWTRSIGAEAVLFNCSRPEVMATALHDARTGLGQADDTMLGIYANAFVSNSDDYAANENVSETRADLNIETYTSFARSWFENGATIIGGCCGIGCEHIKSLAVAMKENKSRPFSSAS